MVYPVSRVRRPIAEGKAIATAVQMIKARPVSVPYAVTPCMSKTHVHYCIRPVPYVSYKHLMCVSRKQSGRCLWWDAGPIAR